MAAVKTGMSPTRRRRSRSPPGPGPVRCRTSSSTPSWSRRRHHGRRSGWLAAALERLLPHALVATPNREEASLLVGWEVVTPDDMARRPRAVGRRSGYVVITGGDFVAGDNAIDVVWADGAAEALHSPRVAAATPTAAAPRSRPRSRPAHPRRRPGGGDRLVEGVRRQGDQRRRGLADRRRHRPIDQFGWSALTLRRVRPTGMMHVWTRRR